MDLSAYKPMLELSGGPAFAVVEDRITLCTPEALALGLRDGTDFRSLAPDLEPPCVGEIAETKVRIAGKDRILRAAAREGILLCCLRDEEPRSWAPNENTLLRTAGSIRLALQDLTTALNDLAELSDLEQEAPARHASLALRSIYRLRRTAVNLELFSRLREDSYVLSRASCQPVIETATLCGMCADLLRTAGIELTWKLPEENFCGVLDWPLVSLLLRELLTNAALHASDGRVRLEMSRIGARQLRYAVINRSETAALPGSPFHRHAQAQSGPEPDLGLGLSLVSAGAARHGGSVLLSADEAGTVTALLTVTMGKEETPGVRFDVRLPESADALLTDLSPVLPAEIFRLEDLL